MNSVAVVPVAGEASSALEATPAKPRADAAPGEPGRVREHSDRDAKGKKEGGEREAAGDKTPRTDNIAAKLDPHAPGQFVPSAEKILKPAKPDRSFALVIGSTTVSVLLALAIGRSGWFTPGDDIGYYTGLVGGVMMLLLLTYPLRKYLQSFRNMGPVKHWFAVHMVLGIAGPVLVLAHSTFHMRSTNAAVALICMVVVAGSGIVGRFLYIKVHKGLYGEKLNFEELQKESGFESQEIQSRLHFAPKVEQQLLDFQKYALETRKSLVTESIHLVSLSIQAMGVYQACARELKVTLAATAKARGWDADKHQRRLRAAKQLVKEYLGATQRVAQFSTYDRLLALWHVAHVPLVYLLVISAIAHVVAVHMY